MITVVVKPLREVVEMGLTHEEAEEIRRVANQNFEKLRNQAIVAGAQAVAAGVKSSIAGYRKMTKQDLIKMIAHIEADCDRILQ